jgi:hypothetical protein
MPMDKEMYLQELLKWISSDSLLVIDGSGYIGCIYCSFKVICLVNFPDIIKGQKGSVDAIKLTVEVKEVFIIRATAYYMVYFSILLEG